MNRNFYSNEEFVELKRRINNEILRRGSYKWFNPLTTPSVGHDKSSPLSLPATGKRIEVNEKTYTINNPSEGSIERTRNIYYPAHGDNPAGTEGVPDSSASRFDVDELRNMIIGLSKIQDIDTFYGHDEKEGSMYRDITPIKKVLEEAEKDELNNYLHKSDISSKRIDPHTGSIAPYGTENGIYVMNSGEYNGDEVGKLSGLDETNFFDDYGAPKGVSDFHPINPYVTPLVARHYKDKPGDRKMFPVLNYEGGQSAARFGKNPRNPEQGEQFKSIPVFGGKVTSCSTACTGLCHITCDNECSESCTVTCFSRCGNACTATCGNVCTGCSTLCYTSCKTKCENVTGYSCLKAGAKAVKITSTGGTDGVPASNDISSETYSCQQCSYTCQFYPNKKTQCWDSGCMSQCFITCQNACSDSCYGGCIGNPGSKGKSYKSGHGTGCESQCTLNCIGLCEGVCEGYCVQTCFHACQKACTDNCEYSCDTFCGSGCANKCTEGCTSHCTSCENGCMYHSAFNPNSGCLRSGCTSTCRHECDTNCISMGCRSVCGADTYGTCEANCRMNCTATSCTAKCSDACSSTCTSCINTCDMNCGACTTQCATECQHACRLICTKTCEHSCEISCVHSCSEDCGGCSTLCYSCVSMCVGLCSVKCESTCTSCANNCSFWCDVRCSLQCIQNCDNLCIKTCQFSCIGSVSLNDKSPSIKPTNPDYNKDVVDRKDEQDSFTITTDISPYKKPEDIPPRIQLGFDKDNNIVLKSNDNDLKLSYVIRETTIAGGIYTINEDTGEVFINEDMLLPVVSENKPNYNNGNSVFIIVIDNNDDIDITNDFEIKVPFRFIAYDPMYDMNKNIVIIIVRDVIVFSEEEE